MAEGQGFEPWVPCGTAVFKTAAFNHSAIPPGCVVSRTGEVYGERSFCQNFLIKI